MACLASRVSVALPQVRCIRRVPLHLKSARSKATIAAPKAASEVAQIGEALLSADLAIATTSIEIREVSDFLLQHPIASFSVALAALFVVPKLIEAFLRYLAVPLAIALLAFYVLEFPEESAVVVTTVLDWVNSNPELTSVLIVGLALFGLAPALLTALGATALVYALLSVTFGTQVPEVKEMQGTFGETLSRVQFLSSIATKRFEQLISQL